MEIRETRNSQNDLERERGLARTDFEISYQSKIMRRVFICANPYLYGQLAFDKGVKIILWRECRSN